jgi:DNA-binding MarR family transcriptional regulator
MTKWLTLEEQSSWRAWISASRLLNQKLSEDLEEKHGLTLSDYEILAWLSEAPEQRMRMSELAKYSLVSRSRLTHQIARLEEAGLVSRRACTNDGRGLYASLTKRGLNKVVKAAPDHVASVRAHLVDVLGPKEFSDLGNYCKTISSGLANPAKIEI